MDGVLISGIEKLHIFESLKSISSLYEVYVHSILANFIKRKLLIEYYNTNIMMEVAHTISFSLFP